MCYRCLLVLDNGMKNYKFKTSFKSDNSSFLVNLFPNKLIPFIFLCYIYDLFIAFVFLPRYYTVITDNRTISIFNLLNQVFGFYENFKIQLIKTSYFLQYVLILNYLIKLFLNLLLTHGDIEADPGPRGKHSQYFSFCHWNLNSLSAHNYEKVPLLEAFNTLHKFDLICLSETYLDSSISIEEKSLIIDGYKLLRADHPSDTKRGGVCIYHKESMSVKVLNLSQLPECLVCVVSIHNKKGYFVTLYRSPSQSHDCFQNFLKEFEKLLSSVTKNLTLL